MESFFDNFKASRVIPAIVGNNDTEGTGVGVRVRDYKLNAFIVDVGISGDTLSGSVKLQPILKESSDSTDGSDGTWTAVAAADMNASTLALVDDAAEDDVLQIVEYKGDAPWVRVDIDFTGTHTNGIPVAAYVIQGIPRNAPPA